MDGVEVFGIKIQNHFNLFGFSQRYKVSEPMTA
jgi:hypothetical protein